MLISACLVAALVRIAWDLSVHAVPISDFLYYYEHGIGIALGHGYTNAGIPTAFWPPGYPLFLAGVFKAFGQTLVAAKASSIALWTLSTALAYILGLRLGGRSTAAVSAFIVALFPDFIFFANLTASENLFAPLLLGALIALSPRQDMKRPPGWQRMTLAGLLLGCSVVVRPTSVLLPFAIVLVLIMWFRSRQVLLAALAMLIAFALPVGALMARNQVAMGAPILSSSGGISLWLGNNPGATGGIAIKGPMPPQDISTPAKEIAYNSRYSGEAIAFVLHNPLRFLALAPVKVWHLFDKPSTLGWNTNEEIGTYPNTIRRQRTFTPAEKRLLDLVGTLRMNRAGWTKVLWLVGLIGVAIGAIQRRAVGIWLAVLVGYWLLFHATLANGQPRFLVAVGPAIAVGAAYAVVSAARLVMQMRPSR
jgi:4-amino-4-deoxy-L-arabinose transferase-like glycosyltransferase